MKTTRLMPGGFVFCVHFVSVIKCERDSLDGYFIIVEMETKKQYNIFNKIGNRRSDYE
mgnify:CR=1 FL=1